MMDLRGARVLITRSEGDSRRWAVALRAAGGEPVVFPCLRTEVPEDSALRSRLRAALDACTWLCVTSPRGVWAVADLMDSFDATSVAVVGPATAAAVVEAGGQVALGAPDGTARSLGAALAERITPADHVLAALSDRAPHTLRDAIAPTRSAFTRVDVYRTVPAEPTAAVDLTTLGLDAVLVASPSAVRGLLNRARVPASLPLVSIGPTTSAALRAEGLDVAAESTTRDLDGMLEALQEVQ